MKKIFILFALLFLYSCWAQDNQITNNQDIKNVDLSDIKTESDSDNTLDTMIKSWSFSWAIDYLQQKWGYSDLSYDEKDKLIYSYLQEGVYSYKESEYSQKVVDILSEEEQNFQNLYFLGFANEIIKNYAKSLEYYNIWLNLESITDNKKAILYNQIGHVYDLMWEFEMAYNYYYKAYWIDNTNYKYSVNIARYLSRKWDYVLAKQYFEYWLWVDGNALKSEIYYSLSSNEFNLNPKNPNIDKAIEYAKKSIEVYPEYPMWYVALARWYYNKDYKTYWEEIEDNLTKSIKLNENWYRAYLYYGLYKYALGEYDEAYKFLSLAESKVEIDPILMDSQREYTKDYISYLKFMLVNYDKKSDFDEYMSKHNDILDVNPSLKSFLNNELVY